jgi:putative flavoprotein involved in K+ transport
MSAEKYHEAGRKEESFNTIVIGGGQAGLAVGKFLAQQDRNFVILDQNSRTGDSWRCRWDSLRLFTPSQFDSLPGMPFSKVKNYFPTKDEVADYLENYAAHFNLPVRHAVKVEKLSRTQSEYQITTNTSRLSARNVVVATGPFQRPFKPNFANQLDPEILQYHSSAYVSPQQIPGKSVLVVGAGNSGAEIAVELCQAGKKVWLSGRDVGKVPANSPLGKLFDGRPIWWFMTKMLTVDTPIGRKMHASTAQHGTPLGRTNRVRIAAEGVMLTARLLGVQSGKPQLQVGTILPADTVIWATGFQPDYLWIDLPIFDESGYPLHSRGVAKDTPGLYFIGLQFQSGLSSSLLGGVGKDAADIANQISQHKN